MVIVGKVWLLLCDGGGCKIGSDDNDDGDGQIYTKNNFFN